MSWVDVRLTDAGDDGTHLRSSDQVPSASDGICRSDGTRRHYRLDAAPRREVDAWVSHFRRFWEQHLDALATELARGQRRNR